MTVGGISSKTDQILYIRMNAYGATLLALRFASSQRFNSFRRVILIRLIKATARNQVNTVMKRSLNCRTSHTVLRNAIC